VYRKQVRRRRAVLALLIVGSFALLSVTYGQGSDGLQRGVSTIFSPIQSVADRALKPARDLVNWFDETFDAKGKNARLQAELEEARKQAVGAKAALAENARLHKLLKLDEGGPSLPATNRLPAGSSPARRRSGSPTSRSMSAPATAWKAAIRWAPATASSATSRR